MNVVNVVKPDKNVVNVCLGLNGTQTCQGMQVKGAQLSETSCAHIIIILTLMKDVSELDIWR